MRNTFAPEPLKVPGIARSPPPLGGVIRIFQHRPPGDVREVGDESEWGWDVGRGVEARVPDPELIGQATPAAVHGCRSLFPLLRKIAVRVKRADLASILPAQEDITRPRKPPHHPPPERSGLGSSFVLHPRSSRCAR